MPGAGGGEAVWRPGGEDICFPHPDERGPAEGPQPGGGKQLESRRLGRVASTELLPATTVSTPCHLPESAGLGQRRRGQVFSGGSPALPGELRPKSRRPAEARALSLPRPRLLQRAVNRAPGGHTWATGRSGCGCGWFSSGEVLAGDSSEIYSQTVPRLPARGRAVPGAGAGAGAAPAEGRQGEGSRAPEWAPADGSPGRARPQPHLREHGSAQALLCPTEGAPKRRHIKGGHREDLGLWAGLWPPEKHL